MLPPVKANVYAGGGGGGAPPGRFSALDFNMVGLDFCSAVLRARALTLDEWGFTRLSCLLWRAGP